MLAEEVHPKVVQERLGHSTIAITMDLYSHVMPTVQRDAAERFGAAWRAKSSQEVAPDGASQAWTSMEYHPV